MNAELVTLNKMKKESIISEFISGYLKSSFTNQYGEYFVGAINIKTAKIYFCGHETNWQWKEYSNSCHFIFNEYEKLWMLSLCFLSKQIAFSKQAILSEPEVEI